eukprot:CAMPEP_0194767082 /NCGR_PEP_ID=MMETSP0323_2-20130528/34426_1 /TAXON_ID=2866 ORGANISM="Crypthecodinium cohnii, Strain Seligo" /NCGR_SAMPLE_ID=MMETSP0323_2 /ASSEMBLY_ACC=CAM_ASM_000346 /LENGTH=96 /DNA_ID=CAMNT_0039698535 /DNA_START=169 /DNA_END=459 /DNA_ORIENTATION=+
MTMNYAGAVPLVEHGAPDCLFLPVAARTGRWTKNSKACFHGCLKILRMWQWQEGLAAAVLRRSSPPTAAEPHEVLHRPRSAAPRSQQGRALPKRRS